MNHVGRWVAGWMTWKDAHMHTLSVRAHAHACAPTHACAPCGHMHARMHTRTDARMYLCTRVTHASRRAHTECACTPACIDACTHVCVCVHTCTCECMHALKHSHIPHAPLVCAPCADGRVSGWVGLDHKWMGGWVYRQQMDGWVGG